MSSAPHEGTGIRYRAAKACKRCNQRRVKCDAVEKGTPCTRCQQSNVPECVLLTSRRGTYPRKRARTGTPPGETRSPHVASVPSNTNPASNSSSDTPTRPQEQDSACRSSPNGEQSSTANGSGAPASQQAQAPAPQPSNTSPDFATPESTLTNNSNALPYCEVSWTAMFDRFLDSRRDNRKDMIDKCSITYLGESFPLSLVLADLKGGGKPRLHHPGPPLEGIQEREEPLNQQGHPSHMLPEDVTYLEAKEVFEYPPPDILEALVSTFLDRWWPIYPIVFRQELLQQHKNKSIPWILLHAICFVAATYCPMAVIHRAGFASRKPARFAYYRKAKALFDTGYERNKIVVLQSVIMLTFWGGGPNNYWNFYSWIGTGVTIAETLGLHRSLDGTNMKPQDRSLLKRLWWTLLIRDASCGALIGRPFRINMYHCDTEMLNERDFDFDMQSEEFATHTQRKTFALYQMHMTKLSLILRDIVTNRFDPGRKSANAANLNDIMQDWRQQLPPELSWNETGTNMNIFASCLCIQYNHHIILLHLSSLTSDTSSSIGESPSMNLRHVPESAAHRISTLACSIVTRSQVLLMSHEAFQGLFLAMVVFYTQMKSSQPMLAQLGRTALNNCQLVLHDAREAWDPSPWIVKLFDSLISNLEEESPNAAMDILADPFGIEYHFGGNSMTMYDGSPAVDVSLGQWQSHPALGNFFGMANDGDIFHGAYPALS